MDLELTEEQRLLQKTAREFALAEVLPVAAENDREHRYPEALVKKMAQLGFLGMAVDEEHGGAGTDTLAYVLVLEEIARACASTAVILSVQNSLVEDPIRKFGSEAQKKKLLPPLARGQIIGCFALSEPEAGSDAAAQKTTAALRGDEWILNGTKNFITNGPVAQLCVLFAMTDPGQGHKGISAFLVPMDAPGLECGPWDKKLGICASPSSQVFLSDCRLPREALLGQVGDGFKVAMTTLDGGRIGIAAQALGITRACLEDALAYAKDRKTFGKPIFEHQAIAFKLADMAADLDAARMLTWRAATLKDQGKRHSQESSMAKLLASDVANRAARECVQIFGGYGYLKDFPAERHFRDAKITEIYEGTSEIQRLVIAGNLLKD
ncbi:MAG TPA: acyl-CoA dehydrogenase [Polyangia bacterium]|nr:acyl-CoA dehydrogenase [Polyangia bacterium]